LPAVEPGLSRPWSKRRVAVAAVFTAMAYLAGAKLGLAFKFEPSPVSALWPPNAILLAALLLSPYAAWPAQIAGVFAVHMIAQLSAGVPAPMALGWFVSNTLEAVLGAWWTRRLIPGRVRLDSLRSFWIFLFAATFLATFLTSFLDAGFVIWNNYGNEAFWDVWRSRFLSNLLATQTIVPLVLAVDLHEIQRARRAPLMRKIELLTLIVAVVLTCVIAFTYSPKVWQLGPAVLYAPLPLLVWAAARFGVFGVSSALLIVTYFVIDGAVVGEGPFSLLDPARNALSVQFFLFFIAVPLTLLATVLTERRRTEKERRANQRLLELTLSAARIGVWSNDFATNEVWGDELNWEIFGMSRTDREPCTRWMDQIHPDDQAQLLADYAAAASTEAARDEGGDSPVPERVIRIIHADGSTHWVLARGTVLRRADGSASRATGINIDITERRRIDLAMGESDERMALAAASANVGFWNIELATDEVWMSQHCYALLGIDPDTKVTPALLASILPSPLFANTSTALHRAVPMRSTFMHEFPVRLPSGEERWIALSAQSLMSSQWNEGRIIGVIRDITEHRHAEQEARDRMVELSHLARVAMVGELSAAIVHEIGQPISAVTFNARSAQRLLAEAEPNTTELREIVADILRDTRRAAEVISQLRALLRRDEVKREPLELGQVVRDTLALTHTEFVKCNIDVKLQLLDEIPPVMGNRTQLEQVLLNVILNARDAMLNVPPEHRQLRVRVERGKSRSVHVSLADTGTGIASEQMAHVFEPYFTSKSQGLGLGLAISRSIVREHGGELHAENGKVGAVMHLILPAHEGLPPVDAASAVYGISAMSAGRQDPSKAARSGP
jgi:signal transduction histidine kinase/integral membrane sensor domain MASE1